MAYSEILVSFVIGSIIVESRVYAPGDTYGKLPTEYAEVSAWCLDSGEEITADTKVRTDGPGYSVYAKIVSNLIQPVAINLTTCGVPPVLHMVQGDSNSRTIVASLWNGAKPYNVPNVPDKSSVMIRFRKPDGTGGLYDSSEAGEAISYAGNVVTAPVATQMLAVAGDVFAEIDIFGGGAGTSAKRLATFRFIIEVAPCVLPDAEIISSDYYNIITVDVATARKYANEARASASAAANSEQRVTEAVVRMPIIKDDYWYIWDSSTGDYVKTDVSAVGEKGAPGVTVPADGMFGTDISEDGHLRIYYTGTTPPPLSINDSGHLIFTMENGNVIDIGRVMGRDGAPGKDGDPGEKGGPGPAGSPGITPHIGTNGNWYLGETDTGLPSRGEQGPGAEVFCIDLAGDYPNYTCPVALADINAAYEAGKVLECRCKMGMYTATLPLFIPVPELGRWIFSGSGELADMGFPAQTFTVAVTSFGVQASNAKLATTEDTLPNPNALTIKIGGTTVTYDGSSAQTVEIADGTEVSY